MTTLGLAERAVDVLGALGTLLAAHESPEHGAERVAGRRALHRTLVAWKQGTDEVLSLRLLTGVFFHGSLLLPLSGWSPEQVRGLAARWQALGVAGFDFHAQTDPVALARLGDAIDAAQAGSAAPWSALSGAIVVRVARPPDAAAGTWRASLVRELAPVRRAVVAAETPDLVALRGLLQLVVDEAFDGVGAAALAESGVEGEQGLAGTAAVVLRAVSFGCWLGLERPQVLALGLAAIALDLLPGLGPREVASRVLQWPGLGAVGTEVVLLAHDARAASLGEPGGVAGRLLLKLQRSVSRGPETLVIDDDEITVLPASELAAPGPA